MNEICKMQGRGEAVVGNKLNTLQATWERLKWQTPTSCTSVMKSGQI